MSETIVPVELEDLSGGMDTLNSPKVLARNTWQLIENSFPGKTGKPRYGMNEKLADVQALGYSSNPSFIRPHGWHMYAGGKDFIITIGRTDHSSYKAEYFIEVWNVTDGTRSKLEYGLFSADLVFFGGQKLFNSLYLIFDYAMTTNHTSEYRKKNLILEYVGSSWTVRSMGIDAIPSLEVISTGDAETAKFNIALAQHSSVVFKNKMWIFGGWNGSAYSRKVYYSEDGITWTEAGTDAIPVGMQGFVVLVYQDKIWLIGGSSISGKSRKVYYSEDGITWTEAGTDAFPVGTSDAAGLVYDNKMWIIGGFTTVAVKKVYYSTNGTTWTEAGTDVLPETMAMHSAVNYGNYMWIIGNTKKVYYSSNGTTWTEAGTDAFPIDLYYYGFIVFNSYMWVIGGITGVSYSRKVYYSSNGTTWTEAGTDALTSPGICEHTSLNYKNKMWVICGYTGVSYLKTIYWSSTGSTWTQQLGGVTQNYYCSIATTFVKKALNSGADTNIWEEAINESMEDLTQRQIVKMLCTTSTGTLLIPMPLNYADAVAQGATHMRVRRTLGNSSEAVAAGLTHVYLVDIAITGGSFSVSTIFHDITPDSTLESYETHSLNTTGYNIPPQGRFCAFIGSRLVIGGNPSYPGYWFCSERPLNTATPQKYYSMFKSSELYKTCDPYDGQKDTGCAVLAGNLYLFKERKVFVLDNGDFINNDPRKISPSIGCICPQTITEADIPQLGGQCILFLSESGPAYLTGSGQVGLIVQHKIAEFWPRNTGAIMRSTGVPTDWYSRNKVTGSFWDNAWRIFFGDSRDTEDNNSTCKVFGFRFGNDGESIGPFQDTFGQYTTGGSSYTIYEPRMLIPIDNVTAYAFSHKANNSGTKTYRLVRYCDPSKFKDTYVTEGAIAYSAKWRNRYYYPGALKCSIGKLENIIIHLYFQDTDGLNIETWSDGSRLKSSCTYSQVRESGVAADNTFRHAVIIIVKGVMPGSFFDTLISKVVPTTGAIEFFGIQYNVEDVHNLPISEFMSASSDLTGATVFVVEADASPEVPV